MNRFIKLLIQFQFVIIVASCSSVQGQERCIPDEWLSNDSIVYKVIRISSKPFEVPPKPAKYIIEIVDLSSDQHELIKSLKYMDWICLLSNNSTDWAANLILYSIFEKDAIVLSNLNPECWRANAKMDDLEYWRNMLPVD
jgi:hypothetical protein